MIATRLARALVPSTTLKESAMTLFVRESLTPLFALACAATVFVAAALDSPDGGQPTAAPTQKVR
jgi:hypothetical protein